MKIISILSRTLIISLYPILIGYFYYLIFSNNKLKNSFKKNWLAIAINTIIFILIGIIVLVIFFKIEKTYYAYDYAGHWIRALKIKKMFFSDNAVSILSELYKSMNYSEYSYLPAVLSLPMFIFGDGSYLYHNICVLILFLMPAIILLQGVYFTKFSNKYLPLFVALIFYPLYFIIFYGEPDVFAMFFIAYTGYVLFIQNNEETTKKEIISINVSTFILLFFRRYHLFYIVFMYALYLLKLMIFYLKEKERLKFTKIAVQALQTGIYVLLVLLLFFRPYLVRTLTNNFSSSYVMFDTDKSKLLFLIKNYSYLISLVSLTGLFVSIKKKYHGILFIFLNLLFICVLFWKIQIFENHHYTLITIQILVLFVIGLTYLFEKSKPLSIFLVIVLLFQSANVFLDKTNNKLFTNLRRTPQIKDTFELMVEITDYLYEITKDGKNVWFATGDVTFDSQICNVVLPDLDRMPNIVSDHVLDIRDKFPDLNKIDYIVISAPTLYLNKDYQKMYDVITYAVNFEEEIAKCYDFEAEWFFGTNYVEVIKRTDEIDKAGKELLYRLMIEKYPEYKEELKYILD